MLANFTVSWSPVPGVAGYRLQIGDGAPVNLPPETASYQFQLGPNQNVPVTIASADEYGRVGSTSVTYATSGEEPALPSPPVLSSPTFDGWSV